eukprot:CAMPEP_0206469222 /NCGR_PEP_ID=MMETSP0324_2-20121206/30142_1 /ASSEMBLY_ACC=CAM_ASM_000836 /TAXON_ID=2866 /ORGANISM="Crypthecodinium cohnii, Strain Seligo" /LENGTH=119 /DNA_ID=CAMNT_0053942921 /DNA_START=147 /DNA_END=504 /DNA_ORIENTATION=-
MQSTSEMHLGESRSNRKSNSTSNSRNSSNNKHSSKETSSSKLEEHQNNILEARLSSSTMAMVGSRLAIQRRKCDSHCSYTSPLRMANGDRGRQGAHCDIEAVVVVVVVDKKGKEARRRD